MRYVAIDLGDKRTGLAAGDDHTRMAVPLDVVEVPITLRQGEELLDRLARAATDQLGSDGELVLGLPVNMDGSEGPRARDVRAFGARLAARTRLAVHYFDERLTSAEADWLLAGSGLTHKQKKQRRDALAAAAILRGFLDSRSPPAGQTPSPDHQDE